MHYECVYVGFSYPIFSLDQHTTNKARMQVLTNDFGQHNLLRVDNQQRLMRRQMPRAHCPVKTQAELLQCIRCVFPTTQHE